MNKVIGQGSGFRVQGSKKNFKKIGILIFLFFLCPLSPVPCTLYPVTFSFAVDIEPMRLEYSLEPGKTYSGTFKLRNTSDFATDIYVSTDGYRYLFTKGTIPPAGETPGGAKKDLPSCQQWFQFAKTKISMNPGGTAEAKFTIKIPQDAAQEHLCAVIFDEKRSLKENKPGQKTGNVQIQIIPRFSIPVYISIKKKEVVSAQITEMAAAGELQKGGLVFNITIQNTGNVHIRPMGTLVILDQNNEVIKNMPIGKCLPIFPGYKEQIPVLCPNMPPGRYSAVATIEIAKDKIIQKKTMFDFHLKK
jgi:hypothetical protein